MAKHNGFDVNTLLVLAGIVLIVVLIVKVNNFKLVPPTENFVSVTNTTVINMLDGSEQSSSTDVCTLSFDKQNICSGDVIEGRIDDGANKQCYTFANVNNGGWRAVWAGQTNMYGSVSDEQSLGVVGVWKFRSICDLNANGGVDLQDCITNQVTVTVRDCGNASDDGDDSDDSSGEGIACGRVASPSTLTCHDGECPEGQICNFIPGYLAMQGRCQCIASSDGGGEEEQNVAPVGTIFVSKLTWSGPMGGYDGVTNKCQQSASTAGLSGTWIPIISDGTHNAKEMMLMIPKFYDMKGGVVADNVVDLYDGFIKIPIKYDEYGNDIGAVNVWTGTLTDGYRNIDSYCHDWGWVDAAGSGGNTAYADGRWINQWVQGCQNMFHIYCVRKA